MSKAKKPVSVQDILCIAAGTAALMCLGLAYGWSVFRGNFRAQFPAWTETNLSLIFSLSMIFFGVGSFFCGLMLRKRRIRQVIEIGAAVFCFGFMAVSFLSPEHPVLSLWGMYLLYGIVSGSGIGICYNAINSSVPRFFPAKKGTISGILMAGYGSGALILGMLASRLISSEGIGLFRTFRILAVGIGIVLAVCAFTFSMKEASACGNEPASGKPVRSGADPRADFGYSPGEVLRLRSFWILQLRNIFSYAACLMIIDQAGVLSDTFHMAAAAGLMVSVANGLVRIPAGMLCDCVGGTWTLRIGNGFLLLASVLLWVLIRKPGSILFFLCFVLFGVSYGMTPPVSVSINEEFFGAKYRSVNYAFFSFTLAPASIAGPTFLGILMDHLGRDPKVTAMAISVYSVIALALSALIRKPGQVL